LGDQWPLGQKIAASGAKLVHGRMTVGGKTPRNDNGGKLLVMTDRGDKGLLQ